MHLDVALLDVGDACFSDFVLVVWVNEAQPS